MFRNYWSAIVVADAVVGNSFEYLSDNAIWNMDGQPISET